MDLLNEMSSDANAEPINATEKMDLVSQLVHRMRDMEGEVEEAEAKLKQKKQELSRLSEIEIPDLFDSLGFSTIKLQSGEKVEIKREFAASISAEHQQSAFGWLRNNGHGSIIKHEVTIPVRKGDEQAYQELKNALGGMGMDYTDKESVHHSTLKSFVKEQMLNGSDIPQDVFGVFPVRKTKIN